jgi:uncharacterized protein YecE (DUF72 family)
MRSQVGTSGFSYPEWKGSFYPTGTKSKDMLSAYAARLSTVEINNTFYRLPRPPLLEGWRTRTPDGFTFAVKASRRITHFKKLRETGDLLDYLFSNLVVLGPRLGPVLFQLPPTVRLDVDLLRAFLADVAPRLGDLPDARIVLEFRHPSWFVDEIYRLLEDAGAALCGGDGDDEGRVPPPLVKTAPFAYVRLRNDAYSDGDLAEWADKLRKLEADELFVYFKHEVQGPHLAERLQTLLPR